ncbi:MAG: extradiol dioxygenase [Gemmatimonadetes bacterium]|nr:MAG: extradiol dioxygenase [Gemmatimonadota bacterium]
MIFGAHFLLYSKKAEPDRAFLRDALGLDSIDAGGGWPIFALPPAEIAVHPSHGSAPAKTEDGHAGAALYLMCDDLKSTMKSLEKKVHFSQVEEAPWGIVTSLALPSGARVGLYQPKHPTAFKR